MEIANRVIRWIETSETVERIGDKLSETVTPLLHRPGPADVLTGRPLGHNAHPMLVLAPMGCWVGAAVLDVTGLRRGAKRLIGTGLLFSAPAVVTGLAEWVDTAGAERNVGTTHALLNDAAAGLYAASWFARHRERHALGVATSSLALGCLAAAGYLGGHLAYVRGVGVNTTAFQSGPDEWTRVVRLDELADREPFQGRTGGLSLLMVRDGDRVDVLEDRCTHRGAPLSDGELIGGCVECPWHHSRFDLRSGMVVRGPATAPQPSYESRVRDGWVEVRRDEPVGLRRNPVDAHAGTDED